MTAQLLAQESTYRIQGLVRRGQAPDAADEAVGHA
jgi:hypothetical protein